MINGTSLDIPGPPRVSAAMTNLGGVPTIFGGAYGSNNDPPVMSVMSFQHTDEHGNIVNKWRSKPAMHLPRKRHSVVSVSVEFLCGTPSTT